MDPFLCLPAMLSIRVLRALPELRQPRFRSSARQDRKVRHRRSSGTTTPNLSGRCLILPRQLMSRQISNGTQNFRQVNSSIVDIDGNQGTPCRVGGFNSATVATPPTGSNVNNAGVTTTALPAPLVPGGSISLEHRFGVIRQGKFLIVGIIE